MAVAFKTALGTGLATASGTTIVITTTAAIAIDDLVVVRWASDNLNATTPTATCGDGSANSYTNLRSGAVNATAAAGVAGGILVTKAVASRASGSTITITLSGAVAHKCAYAESFTGAEITTRVAAVGATGTVAAASAGATAAGLVAGDLVLGHIANETRGTITGDSDTTNGVWSTQVKHQSATSGTDAGCVSVAGQYKIVTATGAQTYNVTAVAAEWLCQCVVLQPSPEPSLTQAAYRFYDEQGTHNGATALAAQDTPVIGDLGNGDGYGVIRIRLQSTTAVAVPTVDDWDLQYEINASGTWLPATSGAVTGFDAPNMAEGEATLSRLTGGTGAYTQGRVSEVSKVPDRGWGANNYSEMVYSVRLVAAQFAAGDTLRFRIARNGGTVGMTYAVYPTVNIVLSLTWAGSIGAAGAAGVSGSFTGGATTWAGSTATVGVKGISAPFVVISKTATLTDTFDTEVDTVTKWPTSEDAVWEAGQAKIACNDLWTGRLESARTYDLADSHVLAKVIPPSWGNGTREIYLFAALNGPNWVAIIARNGQILVDQRISGVISTVPGSTITYSATAHAWWKISETSGTIYFHTSPDSATWNLLTSIPVPWALQPLAISFETGGDDTLDYAYVDNVNVPLEVMLEPVEGGRNNEAGNARATEGNKHRMLEPREVPFNLAWFNAFWAEGEKFQALGVTDGIGVAEWSDESGALNFAQSDPAKRPVYRASVARLNNQPGIDPDGVDDFLQALPAYQAQPFSIVVILAPMDSWNNTNVLAQAWPGPAVTIPNGNRTWTASQGSAVISGLNYAPNFNARLFFVHYNQLNSRVQVDDDPATIVTGNLQSTQIAHGIEAGVPLYMFANGGGNGNWLTDPVAFIGIHLGDVTTDPRWPEFMDWAREHYGIPGGAGPPQTWAGSTATVGVVGISGAFVPGAVTWGGAAPVLTSLWAHDAPLGVDPGSGDTDPAGVALGTRVRFAEAGKVNGVWFQKGNAATLTHTVSLWRQDGPGVEHAVMVASKAAALATTGWQFIAFDAPVDVGPLADISGDQMSYVVACHYPQDPAGGEQQLNYRSIASGFASGPLVNGSLTAPQGDTNTNSGRNGRFLYTSSGASYPDNSFNFGNYLIDVEFGVLSGVASDVATIGVSGISGAFTGAAPPPQTWSGSTATIGAAGISGGFTAGATTWTGGSTATAGAQGISGAFVPGVAAWAGSTATAGVAALSGLLSPGAITWTGGATALAGVTGVSSALVAGTVIWNGSTATVGTAGISGEFSTPPPPQSWGGAPLPTLPVLTGLTVWMDASTLTPGPLTAWPNEGSGPDPVIQGTPIPNVGETFLNDMPVVRFRPSQGSIRGTGLCTDGGFDVSVIYLARWCGPNLGRMFTNMYPPFNYLVGAHTSLDEWLFDNGAGSVTGIGWGSWPGPWKLYESVSSETPRESRLWVNGVDKGWTGSSAGHDTRWNLSGYSQTEETCDFEVAELVGYDRALAPAERVQVEDYFNTKWLEPLEVADSATLGITGVTGEFSTFAPPQTWVGSTATVGAAGITGVFVGGPITWVSSSISTVGAAGISATFVPGAIAWAGSIATSGAAGITGTLVPGTAPWAGSTATSGVSGVSGAFVPGAITWVSTSIATAGVAALTGALVPGATTWAGSIATVGMAGAAGSWSAAGAPATWSGSIATVGTAGQTSVFVPGARTWVSSTAASGVTGVSGAFTSLYTWIGSNASLGGAGQSGDFVPGARTWASTFATVGAAGITGSLVPGPRTWEGSVATVGITALTRPFVPGAVVWVGSIARIGVAGESREMSSGITAWWNGQEIVDMMWGSVQVLDWVKT